VIFLLDVGNSRIKWRLQQHGGIQDQGAIPTVSCKDAERHWSGLLADMACVSSVAGAAVDEVVLQALRTVLKRDGKVHWLVSPAQGHGLTSDYVPPESLGPDRFAALVAARRLRQVDWVVVNVGTALTVDMLTAEGRFLGGAIAPGPRLMRESLSIGTARAHSAEPTGLEDWPRDTRSAVGQGIAYALWGVVQGMSWRLARSVGHQPSVLLSGGAREILRPLLPRDTTEVNELVLEGLAWIARDLGYAA